MTRRIEHPEMYLSAQLIFADLKELGSDTPVDDVIKAAMEATQEDSKVWLCTSEDQKFKSAVGAVAMFFADDAEVTERIEIEMRSLGALSSAQAGIPVDFSFLPEDFEPLGLLGAFRRVIGK